MKTDSFNPALHRIALATAIATFPLIFMGGLVTSHQAGMAVPDWPNSYGYSMFTFPPNLWVGGIFYEHTHRLMGTVVGMLAIVLTIVAWRTESRHWVRWLATSVLAAVILQGVLGGLRVIWVNLDLAVVHGCFAQAFFCLSALMCVVTSKWWNQASTDSAIDRRFVILAASCVGVIYLQLIVGALMRHYQAGLAIPDLPLSYGSVLPPTNGSELEQVNRQRVWEMNLPSVTLAQVWLHFGHRIGAVIVSGFLIALIVRAIRSGQSALQRPAIAIAGLLIVQITLGVLTVLMRKPADIASAHVAVGALTLVTTFVVTVRAARLARGTGFQPVREMSEIQESLAPNVTLHGLEARAT